MGIILGLAAALLYGASDFGGGLLSRQLGSLRVNVVASTAATLLAWAVLIVSGAPEPSLRAVAWGLASGLGGGAGTLILYRGLARGQMSVVGPVSAVAAAAVPVAVGVAMGERPGLLATVGVLVALPAIVLVAASGSVRGKLGAGLTDGLAAEWPSASCSSAWRRPAGTAACGRSCRSRPARCCSSSWSRSGRVNRSG